MQPLEPLWPGMTYRDHQVAGIRWMLTRESSTEVQGGILADEMGLGKTIQMVALLKHASSGAPREQSVLVAPVAVLEQWKTVLRRSGFTVCVPDPKTGSWKKEFLGPKPLVAAQIHVVGYERALRTPSLLKEKPWVRIIYDEAHRLASNNTSTELALSVKADHKWLLTATPIVNKLRDIKMLLHIVGLPEKVLQYSLDTLTPILSSYVLVRSMEQMRSILPDLPPAAAYVDVPLKFKTEEEQEFYRGIAGILTKRWKALGGDSGTGSVLEKLRIFMRLRQLSLHPQVYIAARKRALGAAYTRPDWTGSSTKFDAIQGLIAKSVGNRWILFCHFRDEMDMLKTMLKEIPTVGRVQLYNGAMTAEEKERALQATKDPLPEGAQTEVLLVQLQSGGVGLNLQHFNRILFTGPWWTQALMEQAVGRAVRIGQKDIVQVYHLRLEEEEAMNIDLVMSAKATEKGGLCAKVLEAACRAATEKELPAKQGVKDVIEGLLKKDLEKKESEDEDPVSLVGV